MEEELQQVTDVYNLVTNYLITYSFQIVGALLILAVGFFLGRRVSNFVLRLCQRRELDVTLSRFFASCARIAVIVAALMVALPKLGIQITPFIAAVGALSLGAGLAVQGLLSNYGAGLSIILTRPFVVGDTIRVHGVWGVVEEVHLVYTLLSNEDGEVITIPNRHIIGEIIHNSQNDTVLELEVGIAYDSDTSRAIDAVTKALGAMEGLSESRAVQVGIERFGASSIDIGIRCWVKTRQYHQVKFAANAAVLAALQESDIAIPFPQREVRLLSNDGD